MSSSHHAHTGDTTPEPSSSVILEQQPLAGIETLDCLIHREDLKMPSFLVLAATSASKVYRHIQ